MYCQHPVHMSSILVLRQQTEPRVRTELAGQEQCTSDRKDMHMH